MKKLVIAAMCLAMLTACQKGTADYKVNVPPTSAFQKAPINKTENIHPDDVVLEWIGGSDINRDELEYKVFFGTDKDDLQLVSTQKETSYKPTGLTILTTYYWSVTTTDGEFDTPAKKVWQFSTSDGTRNVPPTAPVLTSPAKGAKDVSIIDVVLKWNASSDENNEPVTYEVFLGESEEEMVSIGETDKLSIIPTTSFGKTYYWKVVAKDPRDGATSSEIWNFSTQNASSLPAAKKTMMQIAGFSSSPSEKDFPTDLRPIHTLDNNKATQFCSDWTTDVGLNCPHWVAYDFGELVNLSHIYLSLTSRPDGRPKQVAIEVKLREDASWSRIMEVDDVPERTAEGYTDRNADDEYTFELKEAAVCKYMRVVILDTHDGKDSFSGYCEIDVD